MDGGHQPRVDVDELVLSGEVDLHAYLIERGVFPWVAERIHQTLMGDHKTEYQRLLGQALSGEQITFNGPPLFESRAYRRVNGDIVHHISDGRQKIALEGFSPDRSGRERGIRLKYHSGAVVLPIPKKTLDILLYQHKGVHKFRDLEGYASTFPVIEAREKQEGGPEFAFLRSLVWPSSVPFTLVSAVAQLQGRDVSERDKEFVERHDQYLTSLIPRQLALYARNRTYSRRMMARELRHRMERDARYLEADTNRIGFALATDRFMRWMENARGGSPDALYKGIGIFVAADEVADPTRVDEKIYQDIERDVRKNRPHSDLYELERWWEHIRKELGKPKLKRKVGGNGV